MLLLVRTCVVYGLALGSADRSASRLVGTRSADVHGRSAAALMVAAPLMQPTSDSSQLTSKLLHGMERALSDHRRIDELVTDFEYSGVVSVRGEGQTFEGQGAVKRFLSMLLVDHNVHSIGTAEQHGVHGVQVTLEQAGAVRELLLRPHSHGASGLISELSVSEELPPSADLEPLFGAAHVSVADAASSGPKWETFDGRVRQRIWQHDDVFAAGNRFLVDTMELSTGRLIMIVDQTVWQL